MEANSVHCVDTCISTTESESESRHQMVQLWALEKTKFVYTEEINCYTIFYICEGQHGKQPRIEKDKNQKCNL